MVKELIDPTRVRVTESPVPWLYISSEGPKSYEDLRKSVLLGIGLDDVVQSIIAKIKTCIEEKNGVEPGYIHAKLMEKVGLVYKEQIGGSSIYLLTDEAKEFYKLYSKT